MKKNKIKSKKNNFRSKKIQLLNNNNFQSLKTYSQIQKNKIYLLNGYKKGVLYFNIAMWERIMRHQPIHIQHELYIDGKSCGIIVDIPHLTQEMNNCFVGEGYNIKPLLGNLYHIEISSTYHLRQMS